MDECGFDDCGRKVKIKKLGLCSGHANQHYAGEELRPLRHRSSPGSTHARDGKKICSRCKYSKPVDEFYTSSVRPDGYSQQCIDCTGETNHSSYLRNREYYLDYNLARKYGLSRDEFVARLVAQDYECAICSAEFSEEAPPCMDHDHNCCSRKESCGKCLRKFLCNSCNLILGHAKDNPAILRAAATYIEAFATD